MKTTLSLPLIAALFLGSTALAQSNPDQLKQRVLADAQRRSPEDYAFTRTSRSESTSGGKTETKVTVETFDPTKPADARWTLVSVDGAPPSAEAASRFRKEAAKSGVVPGYHRLANYLGSPATASTDTRGRTVFRFENLPKGSVSLIGTDISQNATAEVVLGEANATPFAEQVRISVKPMRLKLLMKIERFESSARYRIGTDGRPVLTEGTNEMAGSGMGKAGTMRTTTTYSDYKPIGRQ